MHNAKGDALMSGLSLLRGYTVHVCGSCLWTVPFLRAIVIVICTCLCMYVRVCELFSAQVAVRVYFCVDVN